MAIGFSDRYCTFCGSKHKKNDVCCPSCGRELGDNKFGTMERTGAGGIGYSDRTDDPSFKKFKSTNKKAGFVFLLIISLIIGAVVYFQGAEPIVAVGVVLIVWFFDFIWFIVSIIPKKDWEGEVINQRTYEKTVRNGGDDNNVRYETVYETTFRTDSGKKKKLKETTWHQRYEYFNMGDRVRFIGALKTYEKYDKSHDDVIICAGCSTLRDPRETYCGRCGCVILKKN